MYTPNFQVFTVVVWTSSVSYLSSKQAPRQFSRGWHFFPPCHKSSRTTACVLAPKGQATDMRLCFALDRV